MFLSQNRKGQPKSKALASKQRNSTEFLKSKYKPNLMAKLTPGINTGLRNLSILADGRCWSCHKFLSGSRAHVYYTEHYFSEKLTKRGQTHFHFSEIKFKTIAASELPKVANHAHTGLPELIQGVLLVEKCYRIRKSDFLDCQLTYALAWVEF